MAPMLEALTAALTRFPWALFLTRYIVMLIAFTAHELGHGLAALALGDDTPRREGRLSLDPRRHLEHIGSIAAVLIGVGWSRPTHFRPDRMRLPDAVGGPLATLAGPLANILLVLTGLAGLEALDAPPQLPVNTLPAPAAILTVLVRMNLAVALLNALPLHPLDGYWLIYHALPLEGLYVWQRLAGPTTAALGAALVALLAMPIPWFRASILPLVRAISLALLGW